jgi:histidyl-tRNA synthetase
MDVDIAGVEDPIADTEVLAVAVDCMKQIGFECFVIRLNDRRMLEAFLEIAQLPRERSLDVFRAIDKRNKVGDKEVFELLKQTGASIDSSRKFLKLTSKKGDPIKILNNVKKDLKNSSSGLDAHETLSSIIDFAADFGIRSHIIIDLSLARGLDYYTGPIFEIYAKGFENLGSFAGGGRYDELVALLGGKPTPMTGISMGIDRIITMLEKKGIYKNLVFGPKVLVATVSDKLKHKAVKIVQMLRRKGVPTEFDLLLRGLRKQMQIAHNRGIRKVIIVGEKELNEGCVSLRDMTTSEQKKVKLDELLSEI